MQQAYQLQQLQVQRLIMTQSIQQAIAVLQMPTVDLWSYVQEACLENPLLEWAVDRDAVRKEYGGCTRTAREWLERRGSRGLGAFADVASQAVAGAGVGAGSLRSSLHEQLGWLQVMPDVRAAARVLIDSLDERGYLPEGVAEHAAASRLPRVAFTEALMVLQEMEPHGLAARDLRECLLLQLRFLPYTPDVELAYRIVSDHLQEIPGAGSLRAMAALNCTRGQWQAALAVIRGLEPRPGQAHWTDPIPYVAADVSVVQACNRWVVIMHDDVVPTVRIDEEYRRMLEKGSGPESPAEESLSPEVREYLLKKTVAATSLLRSLEARRRTLFRVAEAIAQHQSEFLIRGPEFLKPLTMKMVADDLLLHESTISRAVAGKYMQTPQGLFELRYFFSSALQTTSGEVAAGKGVRAAIKRLIEQEDKAEPMTDQDLASRLLQQGVRVSRRTVAKYREELRLPASSARRRVT